MFQHPLQKYLRVDRMPHIFCPGCGCGQIMQAMLRAVDEMELDLDNIVFLGGVGCNSRQVCWIKAYAMHGLHGRAFAWATGIKLSKPDLHVIVLTGDGDCGAIGGNHFIHAARRNIDMTVVVANNFNYGMTGGQFAPTTPLGSHTTTTPFGNFENPFDLCDLAKAAGATYVARWTVLHFKQLVRSLKKGVEHKGFSFVEVLSPCPTNYGRRELKSADPLVNLENIRELAITEKKAAKLSPEELQGKMVVGEFCKVDKPTYYDEFVRFREPARKTFHKK
jgi:2-oxoglutarate/2-oxoacid ferredoxin oxidoreductase subunit beta